MAVAVAVGRKVAVSGVTCAVATPGCSKTPSWDSSVRVSLGRASAGLPSSSGRRISWRIGSTRSEVRVPTSRNSAAKERLVKNDGVPLSTSNVLQVHKVPEESPGAVDALSALLQDFEGLLQEKSEEVAQLNNGTTIFLIGMMACGKSTVGRIVADALDYKFLDSDEVIESFAGGMPVKEIFRQHNETAFRDLETRALQELSATDCLVVATGGGAVVREDNWSYLRDGITVWLDVPIEDLAKRVTAVGTESRPLLGGDCDNFEKAYAKLSKLMATRGPHYARAHCRLSLRDLATSLQLPEVGALTPTAIAVQVLEEIRLLLEQEKYIPPPIGY